jgi:hypothetical protein
MPYKIQDVSDGDETKFAIIFKFEKEDIKVFVTKEENNCLRVVCEDEGCNLKLWLAQTPHSMRLLQLNPADEEKRISQNLSSFFFQYVPDQNRQLNGHIILIKVSELIALNLIERLAKCFEPYLALKTQLYPAQCG